MDFRSYIYDTNYTTIISTNIPLRSPLSNNNCIMISNNEKASINSIIEGSAASCISAYLKIKGVRNSFGNFYPSNYIRDVINGVRENKVLEEYIFEAVAHYKKVYIKRDKKRKSILKIV